MSPYNPEFKNKLGALYMSQDRMTEAIELFQSLVKENPKNIQVITNLGYAYLKMGNIIKTQEMYDRGIRINPDYEPLLMNIAGLKIFQKQYKEARSILQDILRKNPHNQQAKNVLYQLNNFL